MVRYPTPATTSALTGLTQATISVWLQVSRSTTARWNAAPRTIPATARLMLTALTTYKLVADACTEMTNSTPYPPNDDHWWAEYHDLKQRLYLIDRMMADSLWIDLESWSTYARTIERRLQDELDIACRTPDEEPTF